MNVAGFETNTMLRLWIQSSFVESPSYMSFVITHLSACPLILNQRERPCLERSVFCPCPIVYYLRYCTLAYR